MHRNHDKISAGGVATLFFFVLNAVVLERAFVLNSDWYKLSYFTVPLLLLSIFTFRKRPL